MYVLLALAKSVGGEFWKREENVDDLRVHSPTQVKEHQDGNDVTLDCSLKFPGLQL